MSATAVRSCRSVTFFQATSPVAGSIALTSPRRHRGPASQPAGFGPLNWVADGDGQSVGLDAQSAATQRSLAATSAQNCTRVLIPLGQMQQSRCVACLTFMCRLSRDL